MLSYSFYESDNRVQRYAETLIRCGNSVDVISLRREGQGKYGDINGVRIFRIQKRVRNEKGKLNYLVRILKFWIRSCFKVSIAHLEKPYDLIHVHSVPDFEVFAALLPKLLGAKVILDIHDIVPEFFQSKFKVKNNTSLYLCLQWVEKLSCTFSDHIIISNHLWEKTICKRSARFSKVTTILNYPDDKLFRKIKNREPREATLMMYPGTINHHQGLDIAVKAFSILQRKYPNFYFHIYGDGPSKDKIAELIHSLKLEDRVVLKGVISFEKIPNLMAQCDIGVIPKRNDSFGGEAFSTKSLEFMSMGIPLVLSRTKIDNFYFTEDVVKFFEPENVVDLANCIDHLLSNSEETKQQAQRANAFVENFRWSKNKDVYMNIVENLVGNKPL